LSEAVKEALYLQSLLIEVGLNELAKITIYIDNQGAQYLASDPVFHAWTKHIDIRHHFVREVVQEGHLRLQHVPTDQMIADVLTKALSRATHERCVENLGLETVEMNYV